VVCKTGHGLAFDPRHLPRLNMPRQTAHVAAQALDVPRIIDYSGTSAIPNDLGTLTPMTSRRIMRVALDTVTAWCHSDAPELSARHIPTLAGLTGAESRANLAALVLPVARAVWADLAAEQGVLKMSHDHYLKMWALGRPTLPCDVVLLDEAQDTNDVLTRVLLDQEHAQRIAVGDSAQQIYSWRGAKDALTKFPGDTLTLSQSFRFGPAIAEEANRWLYLVGTPLRLTGFEQCVSELRRVDDPDAVLCRTNAGAMGVVFDALAQHRKVALVGGGGDLQRLAWAARDLQQGRPTDHPELLAFPSWQAVREYAEEEDGALRVLVDLIDAHSPDGILQAADLLVPEESADLIVSTAHRSKGREWDAVRIHGDFRPPKPDKVTGHVVLRREEARLAYVAVTRARLALDRTALAWIDTVTAVSD
jgi:hypothetical protein